MTYLPPDADLWMMAVLAVVIALSACAMVLMRFALSTLPQTPTRFQRLRHALWNAL